MIPRLTLTITVMAMAAHASSGVWVLSDGSEEERECPPEGLFRESESRGKGLKLPAGCVAEVPGRWTSLDVWKAEQAEIAALEETVSLLEDRVKQLEGQKLAQSLNCAQDLLRADSCECPTWPYWATAGTGSVAALTGLACSLRGM